METEEQYIDRLLQEFGYTDAEPVEEINLGEHITLPELENV